MPGERLRIVVSGDGLERSRPTVFFRLLLALPHLFVLGTFGGVAALLAPVAWLIVLVTGRLPESIHEFFARLVRYATHVNAYLYMGGRRWPPLLGEGRYAVDVDIPEPAERQNRWGVGFRLLLALPAIALGGALGSGVTSLSPAALYFSFGVLPTVGVLAWFSCLARGRMPAGMQGLLVYALGYGAQVYGYLLFLTPRYPDSDPGLVGAPLPEHPVMLDLTDADRGRDRVLVLFRGPLFAPHLVWLLLWTVVALPAGIAGWFAALALGRLPGPLHHFQAARVRYQTQAYGFLFGAAEPFPGFLGRPGTYPLELEIGPPERQSRWTIGFRALLALPALLLGAALSGVAEVAAVGGWFASLFTGRMPHGLRNLIAYALRYQAQVAAYAALVTPRYPFSGPGPCPR